MQFNSSAALDVDALAFQAQATHFLADREADPAAFDPELHRGELLAGHYDDWVLAEEALPLAQSTGDRYDLAITWELLGDVAIQLGEPEQARLFLARSVALWRDMGRSEILTSLHVGLRRAALLAGELLEAETEFSTALAAAARFDRPAQALAALAALAAVFAKRGDAQASAALVTLVLRHPRSAAEIRKRAEELRTELEAQLTREQIQAAECHAASESLEEVVQRLLADSPVALP